MSNLATIVNNILADSGIDDINVVVTTGSYTNPAWIVSLPWTKITGTPTTLAGYGITDAYTQTQVNNLLNAKQNTLTLTTTGTSGAATLVGATLNIPQYQSVLTNPVTGTGTTNYIPKWASGSSITNSVIYDDGGNIGINNIAPTAQLHIRSGGSYVNTDANNRIIVERDAHTYLMFVSPNEFDQGIHFAKTTGIVGRIAYFQRAAGDAMAFTVASAIRMQLFDTGNLYVGSSPSDAGFRLDVNGIGRFQDSLTVNNYLYVQPNVASGLQGLYLQNNNTGGYGVSLGFGLYGYTTGAYFNTLRIESSYPAFGRTLFWTKAQSNSTEVLALNLDGTGAAIFGNTITATKGFFSSNGVSDSTTGLLANASTNDSTTYAAIFGSLNAGYRMVVRADGNVGISTVSPFSLLHVGTRPGAGNTNPSLGSIATISNDGLTGIDLGANVNANTVVGHINWVNGIGVANHNTARIDVYATGGTNSGSLRFWTASAASSPTIRLTIASTGDATFTSSVTVGGTSGGNTATDSLRILNTDAGGGNLVVQNFYSVIGKIGVSSEDVGSGTFNDGVFKVQLAADGALQDRLTITSRGAATFSSSVTSTGLVVNGTEIYMAPANYDSGGFARLLGRNASTGRIEGMSAADVQAFIGLSSYVSGSGTTNYLPKFTGASTIGNSQIFDNGTSVIVNGSTSSDARFIANGNSSGYAAYFSQPSIYAGYYRLIRYYTNGNVVLDIGSGNGTNLGIVNNQNDSLYFGTNGQQHLTIFGSGNVHVGLNPSSDAGFKLDVNGTGRFANNGISTSFGTAASFVINSVKGGLTAGQSVAYLMGLENSLNNQMTMLFNYAGYGSTSNYLGLGFYGQDNLFKLYANGSATFSSSVTASGIYSNNISSLTYEASSAGAIQPGVSEFISTGFNVAGGTSQDISTISLPSNTQWKAIITGGFANNFEGGGLASPNFSRDIDGTNSTISVGSTTLTFSRNSSTGKLQVSCSNAPYRATFVGTIHLVTFPQSAIPSNTRAFFGNAGFGTATPSSLLTVAGQADLAWVSAVTTLRINRSGSVARFQNYDGGASANIALNWDGGNVGVGTQSAVTRLHVENNVTINDAFGLLLVENTNTSSGTSSTNSAVNIRNFHGTSQFMQWQSFGIRLGSRLLTNGGAGDLYLTAGADSVAMTLRANGNIQIGGTFADNGYKFQNAGSSVLAGQVVQGGGAPRSTAGTTIAFTGGAQTVWSANSDPGDGGRFLSIVNENTSTNAFSAISFRVNPGSGGSSGNAMLDMKFVNNGSSVSTLYWTFLAGGAFYDRMILTSAGNLTATAFFESSDARLKSNIFDLDVDVSSIIAKTYLKNGVEEIGYIAQDVQDILPSAISKREDGYLDLSYRQVHTAKIAALEKEVAELKQQLKNK
jgi:hypothetical protein